MHHTTSHAASPWRVLVIDDHELLTSALEAAFAADGRAEVVATAASIEAGVHAAARTAPDVVLTDRRLPDGDMDQHIGRLLDASPGSRILLMTGWPTERSSLAALEAGAVGIVSKTESVTRIVDAVGRVASGEVLVPTEVTRALLDRTMRTRVADRTTLSDRELDVLESLARGESMAATADRLCISANTLRNHLSRAMLKLGVHDRLAAVSEAIRLGLVAPRMPERSSGRAGEWG